MRYAASLCTTAIALVVSSACSSDGSSADETDVGGEGSTTSTHGSRGVSNGGGNGAGRSGTEAGSTAGGDSTGGDSTGGVSGVVPGTATTGLPPLPEGGWDHLETDLPDFKPLPKGAGAQSDLYNPEAVVPPQCYTRTEGHFNPCYVCHQDPINGEGRENRMADGDLQGDYSFSDTALTIGWANLFVDRSAQVDAISDEAILGYIDEDNYTALRPRLIASGWDPAQVWLPDLWGLQEGAAAFDDAGFALDGSWWVAYSYKPLPSTFWPTNGATDDVMIRLSPEFYHDGSGTESREVYRVNLAIVEAAIKGLSSVTMGAVDERAVGVDLDEDGELGTATQLKRPSHYVGGASEVRVHSFLYPRGTEFLHTVRYVGLNDDGSVKVSRRMKEVRYMRKHTWYPKSTIGAFYDQEFQEKFEGTLPRYADMKEAGLDNKFGWLVRGFLEDAEGELRPATYEEGLFCMGCHTTIGSTIDKTFSFARKVDGEAGWGYIDLKGMPDAPNKGETEGEILTYLRRVGGGAEFRNNPEMAERWYEEDGSVDVNAVEAADVYELTTPSRERALQLNKAYRVIVQNQQFIRGRDATVTPPANVFDVVDNDATPLEPEFRHPWDIRLAWPAPRL